jgi:spermidine synthase
VFSWLAEARPKASIAAVGLGAGTVAAYEQSGQTMTFFEIDPLVVRVATDPQLFTYLADAPTRPAIVLGDARLSIRDTPSGSFDLLILDAFSSDAIPTHLVTLEALTDDLRVLRQGGLVVIHVSNRYYDLGPALAAAGERLGLTALEKGYSPTEAESVAGAAISGWVALASDQPTADLFRANGWATVRHDGVVPLTDDHPDILRFLRIGR